MDYSTARDLLLPPWVVFASVHGEEYRHPWLMPRWPPAANQPLLRLWDWCSGSHPDENSCMQARDPRKRLDTAESRIGSLGIHIDNRVWEPTPYISFTTSPTAIEELARGRDKPRRGPHFLTAIHPGVREKRRLPILNVEMEMKHYGIPDPYHKSNLYYRNHYVCLWEVTPAEVIQTWPWEEIRTNPRWYSEIVLPAFRAFTENSSLDDAGIADAMANLSREFPRRSGLIATLIAREVFGEHRFAKSYDSDTSSEGPYYCDSEFGSDTDDEVEEANRADDIIKMIEGDWH